MPSILFNNDNNSSSNKKPDVEASQASLQKEKVESPNAITPKEDDFAIFPEWDLMPPNVIINPRIKKKL